MIQLENVNFTYNNSDKGALKDVSITIGSGECVLLCGESGCGKTTITRMLNGLIPHFYEGEMHGKVTVCGMDVQKEEIYNISQKVGSVFQNPRSQFFVWTRRVRLPLDVKTLVCRKKRFESE